MIEPEERNPWDALVEELGLPPAAPSAHAAPKPRAVEPPPVVVEEAAAVEPLERYAVQRAPERRQVVEETAAVEPPEPPLAEEPPARGRRRRGHSAEPGSPPPVPDAKAPVENVAEPAAFRAAAEGPPPETAVGAAEPFAPEAGDEAAEKGRPRRRRRGRGSRSGDAAAATIETAAAAGEAESAPVAEGAESTPPGAEPEKDASGRPRRRRGRSRGRNSTDRPEGKAPAVEEEAAETVEGPEGVDLGPVESEEELDDLSNLNIPTWAELIASLHRPER